MGTTTDPMHTYVSDHLAGAAAGASLARRIAHHYEGTTAERAFAGLARDVEADRRALAGLHRDLGARRRVVKEAGGWLAMQFSKLRLSELTTRDARLSRLLELEAMQVGIHGKLALWTALAAAQLEPAVSIRLPDLEARARGQLALVQEHRLELASTLFRDASSAAGELRQEAPQST